MFDKCFEPDLKNFLYHPLKGPYIPPWPVSASSAAVGGNEHINFFYSTHPHLFIGQLGPQTLIEHNFL